MAKNKIPMVKNVFSHVDCSRPVLCYRNLHKGCLSVVQDGRVKCHVPNIILKDCEFVVRPAGRDKVRKEKKKNVHAFLKGYPIPSQESHYTANDGWEVVNYNPYKMDHWQAELASGENPEVSKAEIVDCDPNCDWTAAVLAYNVQFKEAK